MNLIIIILLILLLSGAGGYFGHAQWGVGGGAGVSLGTIILLLIICRIFGLI